MIAYLDSSVVVRSYLLDEADHVAARAMMNDSTMTLITGSWTRIEVTGALVRAARAHRGDEDALAELFERDMDPSTGALTVVDVNQADIEGLAMAIVRSTGIRSLDAWHLACARIALDQLAEPGEEVGFATRDAEQAAIAREMGFATL
jgi:predicted nucleic acid-binding protein